MRTVPSAADAATEWWQDDSILDAGPVPTQTAPAMPHDNCDTATICLARLYVPEAGLRVEFASESTELADAFTITEQQHDQKIANESLCVVIPKSGDYDGNVPGPILAWKMNGPWKDRWQGSHSKQVGATSAVIETQIESTGPHFIQWRVAYEFSCGTTWIWRARWIHEDDTIVVAEECSGDTHVAWVWRPLGDQPAQTYITPPRGHQTNMVPSPSLRPSESTVPIGTVAATIGHLSYANQWGQAWASIAPMDADSDTTDETPTFSVFAGWAGQWRRRGHQRIYVKTAGAGTVELSAPIRRGRRLYGITLASRRAAAINSGMYPCGVHIRKQSVSDLPLARTMHWELGWVNDTGLPEYQSERRSRLTPESWIARLTQPQSTSSDEVERLRNLRDKRRRYGYAVVAADVICGDVEALEQASTLGMTAYSHGFLTRILSSGFDAASIVGARHTMGAAFRFDLLLCLNRITLDQYREAARFLLMFASVYRDVDAYCYDDFVTEHESDDGMAGLLAEEPMRSPVDPAIACAGYSVVGLLAELFPTHPIADEWRVWAGSQCDRFIARFFSNASADPETMHARYRMIEAMLPWFLALRVNGGTDYLRHPNIIDSYQNYENAMAARLAESATRSDRRVDQAIAAIVYENAPTDLMLALIRL